MKSFYIGLLAILLTFTTHSSAHAKEYSFTTGGGFPLKVVTSDTEAHFTITSTSDRYDQLFRFSLWKSRATNRVTGELLGSNNVGDRSIRFNQPLPRVGTVLFSGLTPNTTYYLSLDQDRPKEAPYEFTTEKTFTSTIPVTLSFDQSAGAPTAILTGPLDDPRNIYALFSLTSVGFGIPPYLVSQEVLLNKTAVNPPSMTQGKSTTSLSALSPGVKYYAVLATKKLSGPYTLLTTKPIEITSGIQDALSFQWPLSFKAQGETVDITGKLDTLKHPDFLSFKIELETSPTESFDVNPTPGDKKYYLPVGGINSEGNYYWTVTTDPNTAYYFRQTITAPSGKTDVKTGKFDSTRGYFLTGSQSEQNDIEKRSYRLLAPFPGLAVLLDPDLCSELLKEQRIKPNSICNSEDPSGFNGFLNYFLKLLIGFSAVLLVFRIIIEGYNYAVTDVPFLKITSKQKIWEAMFGLLLVLSAYLILNSINPKLVANRISIQKINLEVQNFTFSGGSEAYITRNNVKVKINSLKLSEVLPYAQKAQQATGMKASHTLAIIWIESGFGANNGGCRWDTPGVMPGSTDRAGRDDKAAFQRIATSLGISPNDRLVSCPSPGGGWGGGMGPSQHIPTYWETFVPGIKKATGKATADPWDIEDAVFAAAVHMASDGGVTDPENAACKYFSGSKCGDGLKDRRTGVAMNLAYRDKFTATVTSIEKELQKTK